MVSRNKYRRIPDLYVDGQVLVLKDGTPLWMQVLNQFEKDEVQGDAQAARARLVLALKTTEKGAAETDKVHAAFVENGRDSAISQILQFTASERFLKAMESVENDPEWRERLMILRRRDEIVSTPDEAELDLLTQTDREYAAEVTKREVEEGDFDRERLEGLADEKLLEEFVQQYIERKGTAVALNEYGLSEIFYAARCCEGVLREDGDWDHAACDAHQIQAWATKAEIAKLPDELLGQMSDVMQLLNMSVREAKNSARQGSSFGPSPLPSAEGASTPSTQDATLVALPGT